VFDNLTHTVKVVTHARGGRRANLEKEYREAEKRIDDVIARLKLPVVQPQQPARKPKKLRYTSTFTKAGFGKAVRKIKKLIRDGDVFQTVLSQRMSVPLPAHPFDIYRALRTINPSPYMYYLSFDDLKIIGSSPEVLVRESAGNLELRPIAGTRPRGKDKAEDESLRQDLFADQKERAEHIMLVDLGRNDLGRVSEYGSVETDELMVLEKYSHVMHIVSNVKGRMREKTTPFDVVRACFPAGTVSGAPKIRAMEIIEDLEPVRRGLYAGAIGYFSFANAMDMCIGIRTIVVKDDRAYIGAGAGIVADSVPEIEFQETLSKANALKLAIERAAAGLE
jgi:anthranilate synthase component 1